MSKAEGHSELLAQSTALIALTEMFRLAARDEHGKPEPLIRTSSVILGDQARRVIRCAERVEVSDD